MIKNWHLSLESFLHFLHNHYILDFTTHNLMLQMPCFVSHGKFKTYIVFIRICEK